MTLYVADSNVWNIRVLIHMYLQIRIDLEKYCFICLAQLIEYDLFYQSLCIHTPNFIRNKFRISNTTEQETECSVDYVTSLTSILVTDGFLDVCLKIKLSQTNCVEKYLDEILFSVIIFKCRSRDIL